MELNLIHIAGPVLMAIAFLVFARGMVNRSQGKAFKPLPAFLFLLFALSFRFIFGEGSLLDRLAMMLMDVGIGMSLDAIYLAYHKEKVILYLVPGVLALLFSGILHALSFFADYLHSNHNNPENIELLVELGEDDNIDEVKGILKKYKACAEKTFPNVTLDEDADLAQFYTIRVDSAYREALMKALKLDKENVDFVEVNSPVSLIQPQTSTISKEKESPFVADDPYLNQQWFAQSLDYNAVHNWLKNHKPQRKARVAIVDTGVDSDHEDLKGVFKKSPGSVDNHSHGTHCAGIAAGITNNHKGIGSLNWQGEYMDLTGYPALDAQGRGTDKTVAKGIIDAADGDADIISMSLGGFHPRPPRVQVKAVEYALKKGAIVVVAAGNSNADARRFSPANIDGVIVVSAVDERLNKAVFSNTNTKLKMPIAAPGVNIMSSVPGSKYQAFSGTSMATPLVAGVLGMLKAFNPDITSKEAYNVLYNTGKEVRDTEKIGRVVMPLEALTRGLQ